MLKSIVQFVWGQVLRGMGYCRAGGRERAARESGPGGNLRRGGAMVEATGKAHLGDTLVGLPNSLLIPGTVFRKYCIGELGRAFFNFM